MPNQRHYPRLNEVEQNIFKNIPHLLESYHYINKQKYVDAIRDQNAKVFLDSGAFSAHSLGVAIDIDAYCDYIHRNIDILRVAADGSVMASVLDGIGSDLITYQNQMYMESKGIRPLPCFHYSEDPRYLQLYVANYTYITIGGLVRKAKNDQREWLDEIWNKYLLDGSGRPKVMVHGFGLTSPELMKRYPWASCDSSSWVQAASFGSIFTSEYGPICVSSESPSAQVIGRHFSTLTPIEQEALQNMLQYKGFNYERLSKEYVSRAAYCCMGYCELNNLVNEYIAKHGFKLLQNEMRLF